MKEVMKEFNKVAKAFEKTAVAEPVGSEAVIARLIEAGHEVLQNRDGVTVAFGDSTAGDNNVRFQLKAKNFGSAGLVEIAGQARKAEAMFKTLAEILEEK